MISGDSPFNDSDLFCEDDDVRWRWSGARSTTKRSLQGERSCVHQFGVLPKGNANFTWVQHFIQHLAPQTGGRDSAFLQSKGSLQVVSKAKDNMSGFVLANGSMSSNQAGDYPVRSASSKPKAKPQSLPRQRDIRRALIEADLVDTVVRDSAIPQGETTPQVMSAAKNNMVALPSQLFYSTQIPVCLLFLTKTKAADAKRRFRDRRKLGTLIDRVHREPTDADLNKITETYHAWRGDKSTGKCQDVAGFWKSATTAEIAAHGHVLTPGRYVGAEEVEDDGEPFEEKMPRLVAELHAESAKLDSSFTKNWICHRLQRPSNTQLWKRNRLFKPQRHNHAYEKQRSVSRSIAATRFRESNGWLPSHEPRYLLEEPGTEHLRIRAKRRHLQVPA